MLDELSDIYRRHIALEDAELFPLAARVLDRDEIEALGREMAQRRGIKVYGQDGQD
jgi:hemerythrin-like domain-containing protein